ncbi:hypothetical protein HDU77_006426 [Chytriomyces hyalinus]|nr:hypothetical protein HDU77_006426 [Chytriomyces hyalinus]
MAALTPRQALCKKDADALAESYARSILDFPLLDGCNQEVIDDVDGWYVPTELDLNTGLTMLNRHDDCYLPSDAPWQFTSPNANYVNSETMQTHCWSSHGIWLVNPGNPTATRPITQVPSLVPENPTVVASPPAVTVQSALRTLSELSQPQIPSAAAQSPLPSNADPSQGAVNEGPAGQSAVTRSNGVVAPTSTVSTNNAASKTSTQESPSMLSTPILIMIVVGACLFLALVVAALLLWRCRKLRQRAHRISTTSNNRHVKIQDSLDGDIPMGSTQYSGSTAGGTSETASSARSPQLHRTHTEATSNHFSILNQDKPRPGQQLAEKDSSGFNSILNTSYSSRRSTNRNISKEKQEQKDFETEPPYLWTVNQTANWASRIPEIGDQVERLVRYHGITGEVLLQLKREDIKNELGLRLGPAIVLEKEISQLMGPPIYSQK